MNQNSNFILKAALLSIAFITASVNAIAGNIPDIAQSFPNVPIHIIELMTTIPSLTMMLAILCSHVISRYLGEKKVILLNALLCGITGIMPYFIQNIVVMFISRALFGFGVGCLSSILLTLIFYFFNGTVRSQMIGLQGSIGGLGSLITTFIAGQLIIYGWHVSFLTYLITFVVFFIILIFVPSVHIEETNEEASASSKVHWGPILFYSLLSFISVCLATFFVIKCSTLVTLNHYDSIQDGSTLIMLISAGSLLAGAMYGPIYNKIKNYALLLFYVLCAVSFFIGGMTQQLGIMMLAAFILGYGYMAFVPFLQEKVGHYGQVGTRTLLVLQSLGAFVAPYFGSLLSSFTSSLNHQFMIAGVFYIVLCVIGIGIIKQEKGSR